MPALWEADRHPLEILRRPTLDEGRPNRSHVRHVQVTPVELEEPPSTAAAALVEKAGRMLLLILCVSPIALFPLALAIRTYGYFFP